MGIAKIGPVYIPRVRNIMVRRVLIGERSRTVSGAMRQDITGVKREWSFEAGPLAFTKYREIIDYLDSVYWGKVQFWLDEFGRDAWGEEVGHVWAYVAVENLDDKRLLGFSNNGAWENAGRTLNITVQEA